MKYDTSIFKGSEEDPNKVPGALWKTFHNFGELGEYRILAQTEECVVIRLENETGEGDMVLYPCLSVVRFLPQILLCSRADAYRRRWRRALSGTAHACGVWWNVKSDIFPIKLNSEV